QKGRERSWAHRRGRSIASASAQKTPGKYAPSHRQEIFFSALRPSREYSKAPRLAAGAARHKKNRAARGDLAEQPSLPIYSYSFDCLLEFGCDFCAPAGAGFASPPCAPVTISIRVPPSR